jgi:hypothetical protein
MVISAVLRITEAIAAKLSGCNIESISDVTSIPSFDIIADDSTFADNFNSASAFFNMSLFIFYHNPLFVSTR